MVSSYWSDGSSFTSPDPTNVAHPSAETINDVQSCTPYSTQTNSGSPYGDYSSQGHAQGQSTFYRVQHATRSYNGIATTTMSTVLHTTSSLQDALRPRTHQTPLSPFSSASSPSSLSLSNIPSLNTGDSRIEASSISPLSPYAPSQTRSGSALSISNRSRSHTLPQNETYVHSHGYPGTNYPTSEATYTNSSVSRMTTRPSNGNAISKFDPDMNAELYTFDSPDSPAEHETNGYTPRGSSSSLTRSEHYCQNVTDAGNRSVHTQASTPHNNDSSRYATRSQTRIKTEPDLDDSPSLQRSPELPEGAGGARFVMEHPYASYSYASRREKGPERSASPDSVDSESFASMRSPESVSPDLAKFKFSDDSGRQAVPHSLTAPLRAVNASAEMRACMGVFRLDPFAQLNGVALRCGFIPEEAAFSSKAGRKGKAKRKGGRNKGNGTGRGCGAFSDEDNEDMDDSEGTEDVMTWDGNPAGPLTEEPALIEFQIYFEGMEVEDDGDPFPSQGQGNKKIDELVRCRPYSVSEFDARGREKITESTRRSRAAERAHKGAYGRETDSAAHEHNHETEYENQKYLSIATEQSEPAQAPNQIAKRHSRSAGVFEEYLDIDLRSEDMQADLEAELDRWDSGEESPATPYAPIGGTSAGGYEHTHEGNLASVYASAPSGPSPSEPLPALSTPSHSAVHGLQSVDYGDSSGYANDCGIVRPRYFDSSGYLRAADGGKFPSPAPMAQFSSATKNQPIMNMNACANSTSSPPPGLAAGVAISGNVSLQQLRTQAALRAVSAHSQAQGSYREPGDTARFRGAAPATAGTVTFTPTPASVAAQMQTGLLSSGRSQYQQQSQQQNRIRASPASHSNHGPGQEQVQGQNTMAWQVSEAVNSPYSSGYAYPGYLSEATNADAITTSRSTTLTNALGHGGSNIQTLERRWSDALRRVHG